MINRPAAGSYVLGIDLGSTWCKAAYLDRDGRVIAHGRAGTQGAPAFGFSADDLEDLWAAVRHAVGDASAHLRAGGHVPAPAGVALASRHRAGLWLDTHGRAIGLTSRFSPHSLQEVMAVVYSAPIWDAESLCTYAPVLTSRTLCLRQHSREDWRRVRRAGALHDGLLLRLTGRWATNPATGPGRPSWPRAAGLLCGLPMTAFPDVLDFGARVGPLTAAAAGDLGLPPSIPVAAGYHDGAAATVGAGVLDMGDACITLGTSAARRVVASRPVPGWFGYPVSEDRWAWMRGVSRALAACFHTQRLSKDSCNYHR
jgi:sugar (pentulose or hexulose) kinase